MSDCVRTAYHESGHALIALALDLPIASVTIEPDDDTLGSVKLEQPPNATGAPLMDALTSEQRARVGMWTCAWSLAGGIAERIGFGSAAPGCEGDRRVADIAAEWTDASAGTDDWMWRPPCEAAVDGYLRQHWHLVSRLALHLVWERTMSGARVRELVGDVPKRDLRNAEGGIAYWRARMEARTRLREATA